MKVPKFVAALVLPVLGMNVDIKEMRRAYNALYSDSKLRPPQMYHKHTKEQRTAVLENASRMRFHHQRIMAMWPLSNGYFESAEVIVNSQKSSSATSTAKWKILIARNSAAIILQLFSCDKSRSGACCSVKSDKRRAFYFVQNIFRFSLGNFGVLMDMLEYAAKIPQLAKWTFEFFRIKKDCCQDSNKFKLSDPVNVLKFENTATRYCSIMSSIMKIQMSPGDIGAAAA
jgi:hypothetical protein